MHKNCSIENVYFITFKIMLDLDLNSWLVCFTLIKINANLVLLTIYFFKYVLQVLPQETQPFL